MSSVGRAQELRVLGRSYEQIAEELEVSKTTAFRMVNADPERQSATAAARERHRVERVAARIEDDLIILCSLSERVTIPGWLPEERLRVTHEVRGLARRLGDLVDPAPAPLPGEPAIEL